MILLEAGPQLNISAKLIQLHPSISPETRTTVHLDMSNNWVFANYKYSRGMVQLFHVF
jgi:hypothetical protein